MNDLQNMRDRIDNQMRQLSQYQPTPITQNFQITPSTSDLEGKYAENIDEVKNTFVTKTGVFINKDTSTLWIKDVSGNIRTFKTEEVVELDEKDKQINQLKEELERMKGELENAKSIISNTNESITSKKSTKLSND
jgi:hypothetical protein